MRRGPGGLHQGGSRERLGTGAAGWARDGRDRRSRCVGGAAGQGERGRRSRWAGCHGRAEVAGPSCPSGYLVAWLGGQVGASGVVGRSMSTQVVDEGDK